MPEARVARRRGHGEDAIYFAAAHNRYAGAISLGFAPDGKRIRRTVTGRTKQEVRDKLKVPAPVTPGALRLGHQHSVTIARLALRFGRKIRAAGRHQQGMSQLTLARAEALRGNPAWIGTGLRYSLTAVCAGSAGVHAALIQPHFLESRLLGSAFTVAAVALLLAALFVRQPRHDSWAIVVTTATLCVIAVSYLLSRSTGIPVLIAHAEHVDPLGTVTTAAELVGAMCGVVLMSRNARPSGKDEK